MDKGAAGGFGRPRARSACKTIFCAARVRQNRARAAFCLRKALTSRGGTCYNTLKTSERRRGHDGALPAKQDSRMRSKPYCLNFSF